MANWLLSRDTSTCSRQRQSVQPVRDAESQLVLNNGQTAPSQPDTRPADMCSSGVSSEGGWGLAVLLAAFVVHCIVDGVSYSFAVFYVHLLTEFPAEGHAKLVLVGTLLPSTCLFVGPLVGGLTNKFGCRVMTLCGSVLATSAIAISSFSTDVNMLIATYGLLAGAGFGMMHLPSIIIISFYFSRRRAVATAVVLCGSGVGKFIFAPLSRYLIDKYGWRGANCIMAAVVLHAAVCGSLFRPPPAGRPVGGSVSPRRPTSCVMMENVMAEKRRRRLDSTGSLDGTTITSDGQLLRRTSQADSRPTAATSRTVDDPLSTPRTFSAGVRSEQLLAQHGTEGHLSSSNTMITVRPTMRTVSVCDTSPRDRSSSATAEVVCDVERTSSDRVTTVPDMDVNDGQLSGHSDTSGPSDTSGHLDTSGHSDTSAASVWVEDRGDVDLTESVACFEAIEMIDITRSGPPSLIARPPVTTSTPPSVLRPLSSHPDVFYTGSCLRVNTEQRQTSSDDRKWSSAHADGGPVWSAIRLMLDVSLLRSATFVVLAVSVLFCYLGLLTAFTYIVDHAMLLGVSEWRSSMLLSVLAVSSVVSRLLVGWLTDHPAVDSVLLYTVALLVAGASTGILPSLRSYQLLCGYQVVYGACCAVFITLKSILVVDLLGLDKLTTAYGILSLLEGVGSLAGTPLIGALYDVTQSYSMSFIVAGCLLMVAGLVSMPLRRIERWDQRRSKRRRTVRVDPQHSPLANVVRNVI